MESGTPWNSTHHSRTEILQHGEWYSLEQHTLLSDRDLTTWRVVLPGTVHIIVGQRSYNMESGTPWNSTHYSLRDLTTWRVVLPGTAHIRD